MHTFVTQKTHQKTPNAVKSARGCNSQVRHILRARPQPKLKIGPVNDTAEIEADRVADQVMRMPDRASADITPSNPVGGILRRKCSDCEDETIQRKEVPEIRMKGNAGVSGGGTASPAASRAINSLGAGTLLPASERSFFEPRFGRDLSNIRLHTGGTADTASKAINARAFSLGNNIAFANGEYSPGTHSGRTLMAHEITHALQANGTIRRATKNDGGGEEWDAVWNVGPYDAWVAKGVAMEALTEAKKTGLSGPGDGPMDAWRHCFWNCRMTEEIGKEQAKLVADAHETHDKIGTEISHKMDYHNNYEGRKLKGKCKSQTWTKLSTGYLRVIENGKLVPSTSEAPKTAAKEDGEYAYPQKNNGAGYSSSNDAYDYSCQETYDDDGEKCNASHIDYGPTAKNCEVYSKNSDWLPDAYVHNATCACSHTPYTKTANCVRYKLQQRLQATPEKLKKEARVAKRLYQLSLTTPETIAAYKAFVLMTLTKPIYDDHVYAYNNCCCTAGPAAYPAWMGVTTIPVYPCSAVGTSIRYGGGSCHGTYGCW